MATLESQVHAAKAFLLKASADSKNNLYDHLSECLSRVLNERPDNAVDTFEGISQSVKQDKFHPKPNTLQEQPEPSAQADVAERQKSLFEKTEADQDVEADEEVTIPYPDLMEVARCFEAGGVGLGREEVFHIFLAVKKLYQEHQLASVRFWGKIFGTERDYLIAEAEYPEGEGEEDEEEEGEGGDGGGGDEGEGDEEGSEAERDEPPKSQWKPPPTVPKEEPKTGVNTKTYFVCNEPGEKWVRLPHVTPAQIVTSRDIRKLFTGRLDAPMVTYPPFPGREENYLRAQIARITATTQISPQGYYHFGDEEEEESEEGGSGTVEVNKDFEIPKISEFSEDSNWVHHVPYLLPQGRTVWWNPVQKAEDEFEEEEEEDEDREQPEEPEPETGPQLLTSVAEDAKVDGMPAWSVRMSSSVVPSYAVAITSSNLWPGAHAFLSHDKKCDNLYIGWGLKYSAAPFNPALPPPVQEEFPTGADVAETTDPTVEQEAALKAAQEEAEANMEEEEEPEDSDED